MKLEATSIILHDDFSTCRGILVVQFERKK